MSTLCPPQIRRALLTVALASLGSLHAHEIHWQSLSMPSTATGGTVIRITAVVTNASEDDSWGSDHNLVMKNAAGTPVAMVSIDGAQPGQTVTCTIDYALPDVTATYHFTFQALEHLNEYFGDSLTRSISVTARPPHTGVNLSATTFDALTPAAISTTDSILATPAYRLRAKVIDGTAWGWHAANLWNVNGRPLDNPPPPGNYAICALYWVTYNGLYGTVLDVGPERRVPISVAGSVSLSSNWFHQGNPPRISTNENMSGTTYRLFATLSDGRGGTWETSGGFNNNGALLANLPPPGEYQASLQWRKYDTALNPIATGPARVATVYVTGGPLQVLNRTGYIYVIDTYEDENGIERHDHSWDNYTVVVNAAGVLRVRATDPFGGDVFVNVYAASNAHLQSGIPEIALPVSPGTYRVRVDADRETTYSVIGEFFPYATAPVITSAAAFTGSVGVPVEGWSITATGSAPVTFSAPGPGILNGLPPGLSLNPATGAVTGTPTTSGIYPVWITAANGGGATTSTLVITIRANPTIAFSGETVENQTTPFYAFTAGKLNATLTGGSGLPAPTGTLTYSAERVDPLGHTSVVNLANSLPLPMTPLFGKLRVTASYPGDTNYAPVTKTVIFENKDTLPPTVPTGLQRVLLGPASFSLEWGPAIDNSGPGVIYEVSLDGGATVFATPIAPTAYSVNGRQPGTTYRVAVRSRDSFGNTSAWSTIREVTTPLTGPEPGLAPRWVDINGDGLRDEILGANPTSFSYFVSETSSESVTYTNWTYDFIWLPALSYQDGWNFFVNGWWIPTFEEETLTINTVRPTFQILAEPGYDYALCRAITKPDGTVQFARIVTLTGLQPADATGSSIHEWTPAGFWPEEAFYTYPTTLVRLAKPPGGLQLNLPLLGTVQIGTHAGLRGTITLPGGITINVTTSGATATFPGHATASTANSGAVAVGTSLGGFTVTANSNGHLTLSSSAGATLALGPNTASITLPGGLGVSVNGTGQIKLDAVAGAAGSMISNGLDALGRVLGVGPLGPQVKVGLRPAGSTVPLIWEDPNAVDLGTRAPGDYDVAVRSDGDATAQPQLIWWFRATVNPPPSGSMFGPPRMWINDDNDSGDTRGDDIPGNSSANYADSSVNGVRDLVDFFPVVLTGIKPLLVTYGNGTNIRYRLKQADAAVNLVYTNLAPANASNYHRQVLTTGFGGDLQQEAGSASTHHVTTSGHDLLPAFLNLVLEGTGGVLLIEGRRQTDNPLVLSVENTATGAVVATVQIPLRISAVETMFRHIDLSGVTTEYDGNPITPSIAAMPTRNGDPGAPYPDSATNGKYFVFIHGYAVNGQAARGWNSEIFKRLYQMGSRARFVGITWHGATGLDYHKAVFQAFQTGDVLGAYFHSAGVSGDVTVAAHSLGNMVASHAIQTQAISPTRYYMINAAVPLEAYDINSVDETQRRAMIEDSWKTRESVLFAANWHDLFSLDFGDARNKLTWKRRFEYVLPIAHNFYSPGEDVVENARSSSSNVVWDILTNWNATRGAWAHQEMVKGSNMLSSGVASLLFIRTQAGWNRDFLSYPTLPDVRDPAILAQLRTRPVFERFLEGKLFHQDPAVASAKAAEARVRYDLLARGLPALSFAAAANPLENLNRVPPVRNFDLEVYGRALGQWPTERQSSGSAGRWLHSDIKDVALPYVHPVFESMMAIANLQ